MPPEVFLSLNSDSWNIFLPVFQQRRFGCQVPADSQKLISCKMRLSEYNVVSSYLVNHHISIEMVLWLVYINYQPVWQQWGGSLIYTLQHGLSTPPSTRHIFKVSKLKHCWSNSFFCWRQALPLFGAVQDARVRVSSTVRTALKRAMRCVGKTLLTKVQPKKMYSKVLSGRNSLKCL